LSLCDPFRSPSPPRPRGGDGAGEDPAHRRTRRLARSRLSLTPDESPQNADLSRPSGPLSRLRERVRERADLASAALGSPLTVPLHRDSPEGRARGLSQGLPSPRPSPADGRGGKRSERSPPFLERRETSWD